jgi:spermidine/putrescine transport system substrate-binding protein
VPPTALPKFPRQLKPFWKMFSTHGSLKQAIAKAFKIQNPKSRDLGRINLPKNCFKIQIQNGITRRKFLQNSAAASLGLGLSGCGWTLAKVRSAPANSEASSKLLYIYTWAGYTDDNLLNRFTKETGIKVIADVFDSNEAMLARLQALGGGEYSIIYPSDYTVRKMVDLGLLKELERSRLVGLDRLVPRFQNPIYDPGTVTAYL